LLGTIIDTVTHDSTLVELDPATGEVLRTIGNVGYRVNGLEYVHKTNKLYGTTSFGDPSFPYGLIMIDLRTGAGTPIGSGAGMHINNPTANSAGQLYAWTEESDDPLMVNTSTGIATIIGDTGLGLFSLEHGFAFDPNDNLFLVNGEDGEVVTIDPATGSAVIVGVLGLRAHHGDFDPGTGLFFGIDITPDYDWWLPGQTRHIVVADVDGGGGMVRTVLPTVDNLFTLTFYKKRFPWIMYGPAMR
jgi:hypothetical protein